MLVLLVKPPFTSFLNFPFVNVSVSLSHIFTMGSFSNTIGYSELHKHATCKIFFKPPFLALATERKRASQKKPVPSPSMGILVFMVLSALAYRQDHGRLILHPQESRAPF